jgi:hypothetical protein
LARLEALDLSTACDSLSDFEAKKIADCPDLSGLIELNWA